MDGNKDESLRCIGIAEASIASGDKQRALKFIKLAKRLNSEASLEDLLVACKKLNSEDSNPVENPNVKHSDPRSKDSKFHSSAYREEHIRLIREVNRSTDHCAILGVEKSCSVEEIRMAYKKLSLKVHPDKNKAPGAEEAFKKVCQAFKCLSEEKSRREYDQMEFVEDFEFAQEHNARRRRRAGNDFFHEDFDAFSGHVSQARREILREQRERAWKERFQRENVVHGDFSMMVLLQLLAILIMFILATFPFSDPEFSLHITDAHQFQYFTDKYGVEYYVKSSDFDEKHPTGSPSRADIEVQVVKDYTSFLGRNCYAELQRRQWYRNYPTPHCEKLRNLGTA